MYLALAGDELPQGSSAKEVIALAQRYGFKHIELMYRKNTQAEGVEQSLQLIEDAGIKIACVCSWTHLFKMEDVEQERKTLLEAIDIARRCGARFANTYFGRGPERDDEAAIEIYAENLKSCLDRAAELGVIIVLENEFDWDGGDTAQSDITRRPEGIRRLVERVGSPHFRLTFDACNFYFAGVEPYPYAYNMLREYIAYVHVKDGARYDPQAYPRLSSPLVVSDHSGRYLCLPAGQGAINYHGLLSALQSDGYDGPLVMEPETEAARWHETCQQTIDYLSSYL
ncbi:MAG: sugar phosphate isomerase/epimerase family protein [Anaerolineae bacterium]